MRVFLGRHVEHDYRSRNFAIDDIDDVMATPVKRSIWTNKSGILDQGNLGACTGYAASACIGTAPNDASVEIADYGKTALALYSSATELDNIDGQYPPTDTGSTGLGAAKACKKAGFIAAYHHAFSFDALCKALQIGPVIVGTNWYYGMFSPDSAGQVRPTGDIAGGHEWMIYGVEPAANLLFAQNSWGTSWGMSGKFSIAFADMEKLLSEEGDVTYFAPKPTNPKPPAPAPKPHHDAADARLWLAMQAWAKKKGLD